MLSLTLVSAALVPCKICGEPAPLYGTVDFNRNCEIEGGIKLPPSGTPVRYRRCGACGFLFTDAFDGWSQDDFRTHIYNEAYLAVDPDYAETRPRNNVAAVLQLFGAGKEQRRVLDYGGGNDVLCSELRAAGVPLAVTYDPFVPEFATPPAGKYDLITCFETLEHMPDPVAGIGDIVAHLAEPGLVLFSTLLQPAAFDQLGMAWWYVGPPQRAYFAVQPQRARQGVGAARLPHRLVQRQPACGVPHAARFCEAFVQVNFLGKASKNLSRPRGEERRAATRLEP